MYFSVFSVESLIPAAFLITIAILLIMIHNKSDATWHIAIAFLLYSTVPLSYFITSSFYEPLARYNRVVSAFVSLPCSLHVVLLFLTYPEPVNRRVIKWIMIIGWGVLSIGWVFFIIAVLKAEPVYLFDGHNWDISATGTQRIVALGIIIGVLTFTSVGVIRAIQLRGRERWVTVGLLLSLWVITVIPAVANLKSRQGEIGRGQFMTIFDLCAVLGFFVFVVIYINSTKDRTSFMTKIIAITLVTLLLVLEFVSNISLGEMESAYDRERNRDAALVLAGQPEPQGLQYIREYNIKTKLIQDVRTNGGIQVKFDGFRSEYRNTYFLAGLMNLKNERGSDFKRKIRENIAEYPDPEFSGFRMAIEKFLTGLPDNHATPYSELISYIATLEKTLLPHRIKIQKLPPEKIRSALADMKKEKFRPFASAISGQIKNSGLEGAELKKTALQIIAPMKTEGSRFYRAGPGSRDHYISYMKVDQEKGVVYEAGFEYLSYRRAIHPSAARFLAMIVAVVFLVLVGFRLFFLGALLRPLNSLLFGLVQIEKGDLNVALKVHVEDEIGFMARSFNAMTRSIKLGELRLQRYAASLERKVKERTAELSETLDAVQKLKNQQDGDYFLTSLILNPLGPNRAISVNVDVDFFVEQKKKFKFRKWQSDIGGDICIADNITLLGSSYIAFVNADAMGKSMQGAGGALVLGATYQSIIERSRHASEVKKQSPERWLKNAFSEMHTIFESFDGSMLISVVMGLIEEKTGILYFINAEHPEVVLYRNEEASFIEDGNIFRKLGSGILSGRVTVRTFQLKDGDVLIVGSDGRDDLLTGTDEKGERIINEDETLFLQVVEEVDGRLHEIQKALLMRGELTDDLSLMRIKYNSQEVLAEADPLLIDYLKKARLARKNQRTGEAIKWLQKASGERKDHPLLLKELFRTHLLMKEYDQAVECGEEYCRENPSDTQSLFALSYAMRMCGRNIESIDFGERVRLRDPNDVGNLVNMAEAYFQEEQYERCEKIAREAYNLDPEIKKINTILKKISKIPDKDENV